MKNNNNMNNNTKPKELPLLAIRKRVLFPGVLLRLQIGKVKSVNLVESLWDAQHRTFKKGSMIAVCTVKLDSDGANGTRMRTENLIEESKQNKDSGSEEGKTHLETMELAEADGPFVYSVGTVARVLQLSRVNGNDSQSFQFSLLVEGVARIRVDHVLRTDPFNVARVSWLSDGGSANDTEVRALAINVRDIARDLLELQRKRNSPLGKKTKEVIDNLDRASPGRLADLLSANLDASVEEKQGVLASLPLAERLRKTLELMNRQVEVFKISDKIQNEVEGKLKNTQREYYLRQQLRAINEELGNMNGKGGANSEQDEMEVLEQALAKAHLPEEAQLTADRELQRLKQMQPSQPEYSVLRTYLELMADLPWEKTTKDNLDIQNARGTLDADHHALDKVKKRIVEFLAVRSLKNDMKGPILCLVGPPGVGKTSLGRSVADALGRKFRRIALGGVRDEAEIRGHRRTYIGAMPGNIIQTLKKAETNNPVLLLDEIDKLGRDVRGDPASALLEVLDPEQNDSFVDHYLNVPFDLSNIMFIATANRLDTIPGPLLDRMEVIELPGYTLEEKHEIATKHLIPKQMKRHGIDSAHIVFTDSAVDSVISSYTREAGVRSLDREIASICRSAAVKVAESRDRVQQFRVKDEQEKQQREEEEAEEVISEAQATTTSMMHHSDMSDEPTIPPMDPSSMSSSASSSGSDSDSNSESASAAKRTPTSESEGKMEAIVLEENFEALVVTPDVVENVLGPSKYESEIAQRTAVPGVATGMAWTSVGGEILFIEAWLHRGNGRVQLTGQLGSVMQESVRAALSFIRGNLHELGLDQISGINLQEALSKADLHVHFPAGAVPKDGPSAGVAVTAAILSALSGRCVRADTACTGEITLRGLVLPVGGVKEKVLAAHRAGIKRVVLPKRNSKDVREIPESIVKDLEVVYAENIPSAMLELFDPHTKVTLSPWLKEIDENVQRARRDTSTKVNPMEPDDLSPSSHGDDTSPGASLNSRDKDICGPVFKSWL